MALVVDDVVRHIVLRANHEGVDGFDARDPVAVQDLAGALDVILSAGEVPHEVAPVHEVQLVAHEEDEVLREGGLHGRLRLAHQLILDRRTLHVAPRLIRLHVARVGAVHAGEKHFGLADVFVIRGDVGDVIAILLARVFLDHAAPRLGSVLRCGCAITVASHLGDVRRAVEQGHAAVLFAGQVAAEGEDVARGVLVHRRVGRRADENQRVGGITHHDDEQ